jgi:hypothetical protein
MAIVSLLALGLSSVSTKEKLTPAFWYIWWAIGFAIANIAAHTEPWLRHFSFNYNVEQIATAVFHPAADIKIAQDNIPLLGDMLRQLRPETMEGLAAPSIGGAIVASAIMLLIAALIIHKRVKPE